MFKRNKYSVFFIIIISIVIELILSNITYLNLFYCNGKNEIAEISNIDRKDENMILDIKTNHIQIQNIKIYYKNPKSQNEIITYTPTLVVYGLQEQERTLTPKYTIGNRNTKLNLNSENQCLKLKLEIGGLSEENEIEKIIINDTHIEYSLQRNIMILIVLFLIYLLKKADKEIEFKETNKVQKVIFYGVIFVILMCFFIEAFIIMPDIHLSDRKVTYQGNFLNAQIEGILNGKSSILLQPLEEFLNLENPYDVTTIHGIPSSNYGDYSLYNGKLYSYFGVAPIILLMLPFRLLTGRYITSFVTNSIFFVIMIFAFAKLYTMLVKRYVKKVSYFNFVLGFVTLLFSTIVMHLIRGWVYDIVTVCALLFTILSYLFILSIYNNPKEEVYRKIFFCSICMGLMVLSKPNYVIYYILLFYLLVNLKTQLEKKEWINCIKIFVIPITVIAIFQMWWNYIRFDSIFCFGAKYQLTRFDMKNLTYFSPIKILKGLSQYLFTLPILDFATFPFVFIKNYGWDTFDFNVIMYDAMTLGIFIVPISWIYVFYHTLKKELKLSKEFNKTILLLALSSIILLIIGIRNGVAEPYVTDIKLFLYTFAMILYFKIIANTKNPFVQKIFWILCIVSILLTLPINITLGSWDYLATIDTNFEVYLKNIFEFWI